MLQRMCRHQVTLERIVFHLERLRIPQNYCHKSHMAHICLYTCMHTSMRACRHAYSHTHIVPPHLVAYQRFVNWSLRLTWPLQESFSVHGTYLAKAISKHSPKKLACKPYTKPWNHSCNDCQNQKKRKRPRTPFEKTSFIENVSRRLNSRIVAVSGLFRLLPRCLPWFLFVWHDIAARRQ